MVGRREEEGPLRQDWEPWEARRSRLPKRASFELRDARESARLLLMVVRARFAEGHVPYEHAERLGEVAQDERIKVRERRIAASLLARIRLAAMGIISREPGPR